MTNPKFKLTRWTLLRRSLFFYWRTQCALLAGVIIASAVLIGALAVGDSVRDSLHRLALERIGNTNLALSSGDRFFQDSLAERIENTTDLPTVSVLSLRGTVVDPETNRRFSPVQVLGVSEDFWQLHTVPNPFATNSSEPQIAINETIAHALGAKTNTRLLLRVEKPGDLPGDAPLSDSEDKNTTFRASVARVLDRESLGSFSLQANQIPPGTVFVPLKYLQQQSELNNRANLILQASGNDENTYALEKANKALSETLTLADAGLELGGIEARNEIELRTDRIFLDAPLVERLEKIKLDGNQAIGILSYFVNSLRLGERTTPYSLVSALATSHTLLSGLNSGEIIINQWLADDLNATVGETIQLRYFVPQDMQNLTEEQRDFRIARIIPIEDDAADTTLMPPYPGLSDSAHCRDWDPGFPIDLEQIRDKDEAYWEKYRGTPKAFIRLDDGENIWGNRFGNRTVIRWSADPSQIENLQTALKENLDPALIGLSFLPVRQTALDASGQAMDFSGLFIGFSFFLIAAALGLTGLLFALTVEQRTQEIGTLRALGFQPEEIRRGLLLQGAIIAVAGSILGAPLGALYTHGILWGLAHVWQQAVASTPVTFALQPLTLALGLSISIFISIGTIKLVLRKIALQTPQQSIQDIAVFSSPATESDLMRRCLKRAFFCFLLAVALLYALDLEQASQAAGAFFGAGALALATFLFIARALLYWSDSDSNTNQMNLSIIARRNTARNPARSMTVLALLACGCFIVVAVGANQHGSVADWQQRDTGTGGFALYAETALPIYKNLNSEAARETFGFNSERMQNTSVVSMRVRQGDDASCLNLNRAQQPRLLAVNPELMKDRRAFRIQPWSGTERHGWRLLETKFNDSNTIAAIADQATVTWALGLKMGDSLEYTDAFGETFRVRIIGTLSRSILQGSLIISEKNFLTRFPTSSGYQAFLWDAPPNKTDTVQFELADALADHGIQVQSTALRLARFNAVENTYLSIFLALGGLGLFLGSLGLGLVVLRNTLERQRELSVLRAFGFTKNKVIFLIIREHVTLLIAGILGGSLCALLAIWPALADGMPGRQSLGLIALLAAAVLGNGLLWITLSATLTMHGSITNNLREE